MKRIVSILLFLYLSFSVFSQNGSGIIFQKDLSSAFDLAKKEDKLIFLYFSAPNCETCEMLSKSFRNRSLGKLYNDNYLSYSLDTDDQGKQMASNLGVTTYPTLMYLNSKGEIKFSARGDRDGRSIFDIGKLAMLPTRSIRKSMEAKYKSNPNDTDHLFDYIEYQYVKAKYSKVEKLLKEYLGKKDKIEKLSWMNLVLDYASDPNSYANQVLINERDEFIINFGEEYINKTIWNSLIKKTSQKINIDQLKDFEEEFIKEAVKAGYDPKDDGFILFYSEYLHNASLPVSSELPMADRNVITKYAMKALLVEGHTFSRKHLMSICNHIIIYYQEIGALSKLFDVVESNFEKEPNYQYLDLQAIILYLLDKKDAAVMKILEARELAIGQGYTNYKPSITLFRELGLVK